MLQNPLSWRIGLAAAAIFAALGVRVAFADLSDADVQRLTAAGVPGRIEHCTEQIRARVFQDIFDCGDELFDTSFNAVDGVGGDVGNGQRFTRVPRYDLDAYVIQPVPRGSGPDAQACSECHQPAAIGNGGGDGAGVAALNIVEDKVGPTGRGNVAGFVVRNPPHLFGLGGQQVLAEEMTVELQAIRTQAQLQACAQGTPVDAPLTTKGVSFGVIRALPAPQNCLVNVTMDTSGVQGVDRDLVVRSFGLEGVTASLRSFILAAFQNELGMVPVEFAGADVDNDRDGVSNEILIDDATAMTIYLSAQPVPVTKLRLDQLRRRLQRTQQGKALLQRLPALPMLAGRDRQQIMRGDTAFREIGCARCHVPEFALQGRMFREPSGVPAFRQRGDRSPSGIDLLANGVNPAQPQLVDLTRDQPDNQFQVGDQMIRLGSLPTNRRGSALLRLFSDLKRHDMGPGSAERVSRMSESGQMIPGSMFITAELWGVGSTAPYLHDGSATTLQEAILVGHGGEAAPERAAFMALSASRQADLLAFLDNQVLAFLTLPADPSQSDDAGQGADPAGGDADAD